MNTPKNKVVKMITLFLKNAIGPDFQRGGNKIGGFIEFIIVQETGRDATAG